MGLSYPHIRPYENVLKAFVSTHMHAEKLETFMLMMCIFGDCCVPPAGGSYYSAPTIEGKMPKGPVRLQIIPWTQRKGSDMLKNKPASAKVGGAVAPWRCRGCAPRIIQPFYCRGSPHMTACQMSNSNCLMIRTLTCMYM